MSVLGVLSPSGYSVILGQSLSKITGDEGLTPWIQKRLSHDVGYERVGGVCGGEDARSVEVLVLVASQRDPPLEFPLDTLLPACFSDSNAEWREWERPHSKAEGVLVSRDKIPMSLTHDGVREASLVPRHFLDIVGEEEADCGLGEVGAKLGWP